MSSRKNLFKSEIIDNGNAPEKKNSKKKQGKFKTNVIDNKESNSLPKMNENPMEKEKENDKDAKDKGINNSLIYPSNIKINIKNNCKFFI